MVLSVPCDICWGGGIPEGFSMQMFVDVAGELGSGPDGTAWLGPWSSSELLSPQVATPQAFPHDLGNRVAGSLHGNSGVPRN